MRSIQSLNDIEYVKSLSLFSPSMMDKVEADFFLFHEAWGEGDVLSFHLSFHQFLQLVESEEEVKTHLNPIFFEYVDVYEDVYEDLFILGIRNDQDIQLFYVPFGILSESMKKSFLNQSEMKAEGD
ncbi:hypothetical protein [Salimicrobium flavidum]|uniref:Uncharacterized protein n=1 Tax=Salimicrobium flavidum TaxID=570947 RepID=A0A1N7IWM7_9BACI|nr:hypothetical protein [Salimicrobium flavidum]SIS41498.1 hypothetical protein SAMN05421687_102372 [Salimicrobium flavidum]